MLDAVPRESVSPERPHLVEGLRRPRVEPAPAEPELVDISVVIPAYNEESRIVPSIEKVRAFLDTTGRSWEVIVVDDGSTDGTASVVLGLATDDARVRLERLEHNRGKGNALRVGVLSSRGTDVLISDADLSAPITELEKLWAAGADAIVAFGSRMQPGATIDVQQNQLRRLLGRLGNYFIRAVAVPGVHDTQCGFKLMRGSAARTLMARTRLNGWGIDVEILHLCTRFGWPIAEVPVRWSHARGSKLRPTAYLHVLAEVCYIRIVHRKAKAAGAPQ